MYANKSSSIPQTCLYTPPLARPRKKLNNKQRDFIKHYIASGFNAQQAAISAGYSMVYLRTKGYDLLSHPEIAKTIDDAYIRVHGAHGTVELTWEWKLRKIARIVNEYIPDDVNVKLEPAKVKVGLIAIAELNRMTGDYAPIKKAVLNIDATKERLNEAKKVYEDY